MISTYTLTIMDRQQVVEAYPVNQVAPPDALQFEATKSKKQVDHGMIFRRSTDS